MEDSRSFVECVSRSRTELIYLVCGPDSTERDAWYFIQVEKNKEPIFSRDIKSVGANLKRYGAILASGYGTTLPVFVIQYMKDRYGAQFPDSMLQTT